MKIKPYPKNAKKHPNKQLKLIAKSIKEFGWRQPIVVDKKGVIIVGHGRWFAYEKYGQEMKLPKPKIEIAKDLSPAKVKAYRLADNKLNESDWDMDLALEELRDLDSKGFDISLTGFDKDLILELEEDNFDADKEYQKIEKPKAKYGDMYQLGNHRLICGDSTKEEDIRRLMDGKLARLIFTDPPYNVDYKSPGGLTYNSTKYGGTGGKIFNDKKSDKDCLDFYANTLVNLYKFSADDATIYWWFANRNNWINRQAFKNSKWKMSQIIVWVKNHFVFSKGQDYHRMYEPCMLGWKKGKGHYKNKRIGNLADVFSLDRDNFIEQFDVWLEHRDNLLKYVHPTQKPVRLAERAIKKNSEDKDIVLDVFGGSGSTLMACEQMDRRCYMAELDPKYCDVIIKRWETISGEKAKMISG